jgi:hypothetical protein
MPAPTAEDLYAFTMFKSPHLIPREFGNVQHYPGGPVINDLKIRPTEQVSELSATYSMCWTLSLPGILTSQQAVFGLWETWTFATQVLLDLQHRAGSRSGDYHTLRTPIFNELWELKGEHATADDMAELFAGGARAAAFRQKVLESRVPAAHNA